MLYGRNQPAGDIVAMHRSVIYIKRKLTFFTYLQLRTNPTNINYMGDPDLMPITSYENTILVRIFYQLASKLNEIVSFTIVSIGYGYNRFIK